MILIRNAVETLGFFSEQIALELERCGYEIYFVDYDALYDTICGLHRFAVKGQTALVTFNFIGIGGEEIFRDETGRTVWEKYDVQCLNILVDHPFYFHAKLKAAYGGPRQKVFCVDREHAACVRRFYPGVQVQFLPLAGNMEECRADQGSGLRKGVRREEPCRLPGALLTGERGKKQLADKGPSGCLDGKVRGGEARYGQRRYGIVFTGNYVPLAGLSRKLEGTGPEYRAFYAGIVEELVAEPWKSVDTVMERHLLEEFGVLEDEVLCRTMAGMMITDLYLRSYFRGEIVSRLAEAGIPVHVFGADWEKLPCKKPQNLIRSGGQVSSADCVAAIRDARVSLNMLPWFKDGAHDRVFTSMLQRTAVFTDDSRYLREEFEDGEDLVFFSLREPERIPELAAGLLADEGRAGRIAENGYRKARGRHTWRERARELMKGFL